MFTAHCYPSLKQALPLWQSDVLPVHGVAQSAWWSQCWQENVNSDCVVLALKKHGQPALLLPLEITRIGKRMIARYIGGSHANCNFPVLFTALSTDIQKRHLQELFACLRKARPDISLISLTGQMKEWLGVHNPLLLIETSRNPNPALMASLPNDFGKILERSNPARKRKKHRQHARRYDEAGGWRVYTAVHTDEAISAFNAFFRMKSERFAEQGISNSFAGEGIPTFFEKLYGSNDEANQRQYRLHVLEVAGIIRAVVGCSYWTDSDIKGLTVEFGAFANDDLVTASPGDFLFFETIEHAIQNGMDYYSFGIGDEKYKRDWCDIELPLYDTYIPLTLGGELNVWQLKLRSALVTRIKESSLLWPIVKKFRRFINRAN